MRKIKWACDEAATHYALACMAITEAGVSKKHVNEAGYRREIAEVDTHDRRVAGEYWVELTCPPSALLVKTYHRGCVVWWDFTWPDLKLLKVDLRDCKHLPDSM